MIYKNNVDNREYKFTNKFNTQSDKIAQIQALNKMGDYNRDKHLMWLCAGKYMEAL
jgi:hypothetical protein